MIILIRKAVICFTLFLLFKGATYTQTLPVPLQQNLEKMDLLLSLPLENSYKVRKVRKSEYFQADYILKNRKKKVEIQYRAIVDTEEKIIPPIYTTAIVTNLATNNESRSTIAVHEIDNEVLLQDLNAEWGTISFFQPKRAISNYKHAKLVSLYKKGKGMVYILFLFDEGAEEEVDYFPAKFEA